MGSFSYTSCADFFLCGEFLFHIPCSLLLFIFLTFFLLFFFFFSFSVFRFSSGEFLLHIPCWLHIYLGCFSYTSHAAFSFLWGVSLTHPVLASFLSSEFLLNIPCCLHFYLGSFSYTSHAAFTFLSFSFSFYISLLLLFSFLFFFFLFKSGEFLLHIPCWLHFYLGSFSYTSRAGFILSGKFLLHIPCWIRFYLGSFSYTSHAGFSFLWEVSLTRPLLALSKKEDILKTFTHTSIPIHPCTLLKERTKHTTHQTWCLRWVVLFLSNVLFQQPPQ